MPNQILQDVLSTTAAFLDTAFELPLEQEILLADYDLPVFKIIRSTVRHTITQKYINGSRLIIEGFFRTEIFYQSSSPARLTSVSKKIPFQKQFDLADAVQPPYFINIEGSLQYINTRAVNSSRIESRGVYRFTVKGYSSVNQQTATAVDSTSVCIESNEMNYFALCGRSIRQFTVEDEISFDSQPGRILHISARPGTLTTQLHRDKVTIKGDLDAEIIYTDEDSGEVYKITKSFRCNQVVDIPGADEGCIACAELSVMAVTVTQNSEKQNINCMITSQLDVKAFRKHSIITVTDAFSRSWLYTAEDCSVTYDSNILSVSRNASVTVEDEIGPGYEAVHCSARAAAPVITSDGDRMVLRSLLSFSIIVKNKQGEYECFTKTENVILNTAEEISEDNDYFLTVNVTGCTPQLSGETLKVKAGLNISGFIICRSTINTLKSFEENKDKPADTADDTLILYYGKKGEKLFDIAKKYKTDIQVIMTENSVESGMLADDRMLFIPSFRQ